MPKFILDGKEYGGSGGDSAIEITQAEYNELLQSNSIQKDVTYYIKDSKDEIELDASIIEYDNSDSGLEATDVQSAIDEVKNEINEQNKNINDCFQSVSDGKALVASALTDKGVETAEDATFETIAENIGKIASNYIDRILAIAYIDFKKGDNTHGTGYNYSNYFTLSAGNGTLTVKSGVKAAVFTRFQGKFNKYDKLHTSSTTYTIADGTTSSLNFVIAIAYE